MSLYQLWNRCQEIWRHWFPQKSLGQRGEDAAASYLRRRGFQIVARGDRGRYGEIDLIAVEQDTVVFVEVKTRSSNKAGEPAEAVDADKQARLTRLALTFLRQHDLLENPARFDVVAVTWSEGTKYPDIKHVPNAFEACGKWQMFR